MECNEWLCFGNSKWRNKKTGQQRAEEMQHLRTYCRNLSLRFTFAINKICHKFGAIIIVVIWVMEFITRGWKISYILFSEYMFVFRGNFCILWIDNGQLISKAIYGRLTCPKIWTGEFVLFASLHFSANK